MNILHVEIQFASEKMKAVIHLSVFVAGLVIGILLLGMLGESSLVQSSIQQNFWDNVVSSLRIFGSEKSAGYDLSTYLSFVSVLMTAVTAVLAALAIGIGVVAAYTFKEIKEEAQKVASNSVDRAIEAKLSDEVIQARIDTIAFATKAPEVNTELENNFEDDAR